MRTELCTKLVWLAALGSAVWGCSSTDEGKGSPSGDTNASGGSSQSMAGSAGTPSSGGVPGTGGILGGAGTPGSGGLVGFGGVPGTGGILGSGGTPGSGGLLSFGGAPGITGGSVELTGGGPMGGETVGGSSTTAGSAGVAVGGESPAAGGSGTGGAENGGTVTGDDCTIGAFATSDPSVEGPFATVTEEDVGPEAGEANEDGTIPRFTLFRPEDMTQSGLCHPVITWGNGTGATPTMYGGLLRHLASHGFVVIGSNSENVARGDPRPMNVGVTWVLEQNDDPSSALYHRLDATHIGATGHSQGAMATSQASSDERITTSVPIEGAMAQRNLHGPAMFFCGGLDDLVGCDGARSALDAVTDLPAMYANYLTVDHGSWMSFGGTRTDVETAIVAWMRVHLMGDEVLRPWFYGASCQLCTDTAWEIDRKNMDQ